MDGAALVAQHFAGGGDQVAGGGIERADLVEHQLLVGQCLRHDHRCSQRGHGRGRRPIDALHQLEVVLANHVEREIALDVDRHLSEQVCDLLARVKEHFFAHHTRLLGIGGLQLARLGLELGVELLADVNVLFQSLHQRPDVDLFLLDRRVIAQQFVLAALERFDDRVQVRL